MLSSFAISFELAEDGGLRAAGQHVAGERDLALAVDAVDRGGPGARHDAHHFVETAPSRAWTTARSSCARPSTLPRNCSWARTRDIVLVVAGVEGGGVLAGDQRVERLLDIQHARRRDRRRAGGRSRGALPACRCAAWCRRPPAPGMVFIFASSASEYLASFCRSGPWMKY